MRTILFFLILFLSIYSVEAQKLNPYILGFETTESVSEIKSNVAANLESNDIKVVGQYQPANDKDRWILIFSTSELEDAVKKVGGLSGFAATLRVGITRQGDKTLVSYTNPVYWGNAYFRDDYDKISSNYSAINSKLESAMKASGSFVGTPFGSKKGLEADELRKYHYMFGMPRFDDTVELEDFDSHQAAKSKIESAIKKGTPNLSMVYKVEFPEKELIVYGFALSGDTGESKFLPTIDIGTPKHTAFLPYEILVKGSEVHMLHGRYRIALSFPDLTMGTFSKIMSTPGNIEDLLIQLVK